jgi:predicted ATPase/DNA-binding winged helix-turn-helix (wHTH) protein
MSDRSLPQAAPSQVVLANEPSFRLGDLEIRPSTREAVAAAFREVLEPRVAQVLVVLARANGAVVSRDELVDRCWQGRIVSDDVVNRILSRIRRLSEKDAGASFSLETIKRVGYRLMAAPNRLADGRLALTSVVVPASGPIQRQPATNLPRRAGELFGRKRELDQVTSQVTSHRLVTISGPGGVGKTRLAIEAGQALLGDRPDGVWVVEFASVFDAALVADTVTTALKLQLSANIPPLDNLVNQLRNADLLIILDNCEHLVEAIAAMADRLMRDAPGVRLLATTQEPLAIEGEHVLRLQPLPVPEGELATAGEAMAFDSVRLFVQLAQRADETFLMDDRAAGAVSLVCRRLDGIPLALAMAAARAPALGVDALLQLLDQRFRILTDGRRAALPRHLTLHATLDWSFGLLSQREKAVFRRLGVFAGAFSLETAKAIVESGDLDGLGVVECILDLVEKSLLIVLHGEAGVRYRLLETSRFYALEKLDEAGEHDEWSRRHAHELRRHFERCTKDSFLLSDQDFLVRYTPELGDLRLATRWAFAAEGEAETAIALVGSAMKLFDALALDTEAERLTDIALNRLTPAMNSELQAALWQCRAFSLRSTHPSGALEASETACALSRLTGNPWSLAASLAWLCHSLWNAGFTSAMLEPLRELDETARRLDSKYLMAVCCGRWQNYWYSEGEFDKAIEVSREGERLAEEAGASGLALVAQLDRQACKFVRGLMQRDGAQWEAAKRLVGQLKLSRAGSSAALAGMVKSLFGFVVYADALDEARSMAGETLMLIRDYQLVWQGLDHFALYAAKLGKMDKAAMLVGYVDATFRARKVQRMPNEDRSHKASMALLQGSLEAADLDCLLARGALLTEEASCCIASNLP